VAGKIGYLHPKAIDPPSPSLTTLRPVWERLGYVEGETVLLRAADGDPKRLPVLVKELVSLGARVLIAVGPAAVNAAGAAGTVPVVAMDLETDPVRSGLAASFGRPGGKVTGLFMDQPSLELAFVSCRL
jgi:putative ABC transport system substrate-binding protein